MDSNALKNEFLVESFENLSSISEDLTKYEKDPANKDILNKIYRTVHTMKGSASFLGYKKLQELTHSAENLLDALREDLIKLSSDMVDCLLTSFDICHSIIKSIESDDSEGDKNSDEIKSKLELFLDPPEEVDESQNSVSLDELDELIAIHRVENEVGQKDLIENELKNKIPPEKRENSLSSAAMESLKELVDNGKVDSSAFHELNQDKKESETNEQEQAINAAALESLKELTNSGAVDASVLDELNNLDKKEVASNVIALKSRNVEVDQINVKVKEDKIASESSEQNVSSSSIEVQTSIADTVVRVNVAVLDKIMNLVGELVLNRNQVVQYSNDNMGQQELVKLSQQLSGITSELQGQVMSTRMQPIGSVLTKFERLVRDFARENDKKINLVLSGQETELDKTLIEAIRDPLVHIIRNAADHGLEGIEERKLAGKTPDGSIWIKAYNESGKVTVEISDNGRGMKRDRILAKAIEKSIITEEQAELMNDQQIFSLVFQPGFSTAEKITNISGRGVGMDVVKTNIEKIGGTISISSEEGQGTTFKLRIPLTLAIVPALIVKSSGQSFAIPQLNLVELVRLESEEELTLVENISGSEFLRLRGNLTPLFRLNETLRLDEIEKKHREINALSNSKDNKFEKVEAENSSLNIVILNAENNFFGVIVDDILDTEEIVVKPLDKMRNLNIFGGATIMGDGSVALILEAFGYLNKFSALRDSNKEIDYGRLKKIDEIEQKGEMQENLLFELNDSRIYAIPLSLVSRLEEFDIDKIEKIGKQPVIRYLNAPMPLINLEETLGLISKDKKLEINKSQKISCIVAAIRGKNYGLVVKEIKDISIDKVEIDDTAVDREGILGTIFVQNKTVSLIDLYAIVESQGMNKSVEIIKSNIKDNKTKKILLVDDSAMYRKMESDALQAFGFQVDVGINGEDGLNQLEKESYDLLITDIEMPVLDGYEFAKRIRKNEKLKDLKIVALSTRSSEKDKEKGKDAGFDYHLEKFKKDEVLNLVSNILKGS